MPRAARIVVPGVPYHITQRGNRREDVFFCDGDRNLYLKLLLLYSRNNGLAVKGYCLMTNHVHLVAVPERETSLCDVFKPVHVCYAQHVNRARRLTGHVWQGRFYSCPLDDAHYIRAMRYVERNPVRARMAEHAVDYPWSSAAGHCGLRQDVFAPDAEFLAETAGDWRTFLSEDGDAGEVERLRAHTRTGKPLGGVTFLTLLETHLKRPVRSRPRGRPRKETGER
mgnify:CR=1 FL=1